MSGKKIWGRRTLELICRVGSSWFGAEDEGKGETKDVTGFQLEMCQKYQTKSRVKEEYEKSSLRFVEFRLLWSHFGILFQETKDGSTFKERGGSQRYLGFIFGNIFGNRRRFLRTEVITNFLSISSHIGTLQHSVIDN